MSRSPTRGPTSRPRSGIGSPAGAPPGPTSTSTARSSSAIANGAIPVTNLAKDAQRLRVVTDRGRLRPAHSTPARDGRRNGRGLAAADYDNDGDLDLAVASVGGALELFRNDGAKGNWLEVALRKPSPGAVVTVVLPDGRRLVREMRAGGSYLSSEDPARSTSGSARPTGCARSSSATPAAGRPGSPT